MYINSNSNGNGNVKSRIDTICVFAGDLSVKITSNQLEVWCLVGFETRAEK